MDCSIMNNILFMLDQTKIELERLKLISYIDILKDMLEKAQFRVSIIDQLHLVNMMKQLPPASQVIPSLQDETESQESTQENENFCKIEDDDTKVIGNKVLDIESMSTKSKAIRKTKKNSSHARKSKQTTNTGKNHFSGANKFIEKFAHLLSKGDGNRKEILQTLVNFYRANVNRFAMSNIAAIWKHEFLNDEQLYSRLFSKSQDAKAFLSCLPPSAFKDYLNGVRLYFKRGVENQSYNRKIKNSSNVMVGTAQHYLRFLNNTTELRENHLLLSKEPNLASSI